MHVYTKLFFFLSLNSKTEKGCLESFDQISDILVPVKHQLHVRNYRYF